MAMTMSLTAGLSEHKAPKGMALAASAFSLQTAVDTTYKFMALHGHPTAQIILINACFALVPILAWAMVTGGFVRLRTLRLPQHMARGSMGVLSAFAAIYAFTSLPLTDFYAIVFAGPLIVTAMSAFWLDEKIDLMRWFAITVGFCGIMFIVNPLAVHTVSPGHNVILGRFAAFISIFCYALSAITVRRMRMGESNLAFSFYQYVVAILIGGIILLIKGGPSLSMSDIAHLALSGTMAGIGSICLMTAYHRSPVALVAPFQYTQIIWGALAGYLIWANVPSAHLVMGAGIVAASGLYVIYREIRLSEQVLQKN